MPALDHGFIERSPGVFVRPEHVEAVNVMMLLDVAAREAIDAFNAGGSCSIPGQRRCVACFADRVREAADRHGLDGEKLMRHAVVAIAATLPKGSV